MKDKIKALDIVYPIENEPFYSCCKCGRKFEKGDTDYLTFEGNVYIGEDTDFISNNIPETEEDINKFRREDIGKKRICLSCFMTDMNNLKTKTLDELKAKAEKLIKQIEQLNNEKPLDIPSFLKGQN